MPTSCFFINSLASAITTVRKLLILVVQLCSNFFNYRLYHSFIKFSFSMPLSYGIFSILLAPNLEQARELALGTMPKNLASVIGRKFKSGISNLCLLIADESRGSSLTFPTFKSRKLTCRCPGLWDYSLLYSRPI